MSSALIEAYLSLVKLGIGHKAEIPEVEDWEAVKHLASRQGMAAIVLDGVKCLTDRASDSNSEDSRKAADSLKRMAPGLGLKWVGENLVVYEQRYEKYKKVISKMAEFYGSRGYKMMILKGYGLSLNYPVPSHRPCGDIDIYQFGKYKEADQALGKELGIKIDDSHHHHTTFRLGGFLVENHYDFVNVHYGHGNRELEKVFKSLAEDDSNYTETGGHKVYLPSVNLHALFQIRHCMLHFASSEINLRQVLDWGLFVEKHSSEIDWKYLAGVMEKFRMTDFFNYLNAVCIEDLGFERGLFPSAENIDKELKQRVLGDIISPEFAEEEPAKKGVFSRVAFKYRRWQANAWKQKLCYNDSRFLSFWKSVWAHVLKPDSI